MDKNHSHSIELVRRQYSGNAQGFIKGIGLVNCLYVNPEAEQFWILDYRIYDLAGDGKTKLDHVREMLLSLVGKKSVSFTHVLFDSWYATKTLMLLVESFGKIYYCPLKYNRKLDDSDGLLNYQAVEQLKWNTWKEKHGKFIKIHGFPKEHKVNLFRVVVSENRTDWVVTNDHAQNSTQATREVCPALEN